MCQYREKYGEEPGGGRRPSCISNNIRLTSCNAQYCA
jgi:hypothetical protein